MSSLDSSSHDVSSLLATRSCNSSAENLLDPEKSVRVVIQGVAVVVVDPQAVSQSVQGEVVVGRVGSIVGEDGEVDEGGGGRERGRIVGGVRVIVAVDDMEQVLSRADFSHSLDSGSMPLGSEETLTSTSTSTSTSSSQLLLDGTAVGTAGLKKLTPSQSQSQSRLQPGTWAKIQASKVDS